MARIRTIKPEFWLNEELAGVSEAARLIAIGLLNLSDDEGWFKSHPRLVESALFPFSEPSVSVQECINQLSNIGYISIFKGLDGKLYGKVMKFTDHQKVNRPTPSKIAALINITEDSVSIHGELTGGKERKGKERKGTGNREGKGNEKAAPIKKPESFKRFFSEYPPNKKGGTDATAWKKAKALKLTEEDFELMANDVSARKAMCPNWYNQFALGITRYMDEKFWLTSILPETATATKEEQRQEMIRKRNEELGISQPSTSEKIIEGEVIHDETKRLI